MRAAFVPVLSIALLGARAALAQALAPPVGCEVTADSRTGGAIDIVPASRVKGANGPQIVWQPVGSGPTVILWVTYAADEHLRMDNPNGVMIRFRKGQHDADTLAVTVKARNGQAWRFDGKAIVADNAEAAHVAFGMDWPYGRGMLDAVASGQAVTISVEQDGSTLHSETFGLANIEARDNLLAEARSKFIAAAQGPCPAVRPQG